MNTVELSDDEIVMIRIALQMLKGDQETRKMMAFWGNNKQKEIYYSMNLECIESAERRLPL